MTEQPLASATEDCLPENAFRELKPGESYEPVIPAGMECPELTLRSIVAGLRMVHHILRCRDLHRSQTGSGDRVGHSHLNPGRRILGFCGEVFKASRLDSAGERQCSRNRRNIRDYCRRVGLHHAGHLYPGAGKPILPVSDFSCASVRSLPRDFFPCAIPPLFRAGSSRQASLSRSSSYDRNPDGRQAGRSQRHCADLLCHHGCFV